MKLFWLCLLLFVPAIANADSPLPPPSVQKTWSHNRRFYVVTNPLINQTQIYQATSSSQGKRTWRMSGYFRQLDLSNDGKYLVAGYDGFNLLSLDYRPGDPLVRFYGTKGLIGTITVAQLFPDRSKLQRTMSHYAWGSNLGFDKQGRYVVKTIDGRKLFYDATTAKQLS